MRLRARLAALTLALGLLAGCASIPAAAPAATATPEPTATPDPQPVVTELRFSATGDNLIHSSIYKQANRRAGGNGYDFGYCYQNMLDFYQQFDINWINQETLISDTLEPSDYPAFSTPGEMGHTLYDIGFRVFSMSNNHTYDRGAAGIAATRAYWAAMPDDVVTCGLYTDAEHHPADQPRSYDTEIAEYPEIAYQEVNGVRIAYLAYTEHTNGIPTPSSAEATVIYTSQTDVMERQIRLARQQADLVVVSDHWGVEDSHFVTDAQRALAQQQVDWGADVILGTHPHVVQDAQWLTSTDGRQAFVAYSLGNFISAQSQPDEMIGLILNLQIEKVDYPDGTSQTAIHSPVLHPVINHYDSGYSNIRVYLLKDYPDELANSHGVRARHPEFGPEYIRKVLTQYVNEEFLDL